MIIFRFRSEFLFALLLFCSFIVGCSKQLKAEPDDIIDQSDFQIAFEEVLKELNRDPCDSDQLRPLEQAASLSISEIEPWREVLSSKRGDALVREALRYAQETDDEEDLRDRTVMFLMLESAKHGSAMGMNEVGAALMYCYQNVEQDYFEAAKWFEAAIEKRDTMAMLSLGRLHAKGLLGDASSGERAKLLFNQCAQVGNTECADELELYSEFGRSTK